MDLYKIRQELNLGIPLTKMSLRVTYYSRVSTDHIEQKSSLKNQVDHFHEMIKNNPNWTYIPGYVDEGISGTTDFKRNNFMKMINDARSNKFDLIVTKEISRFSRNTLDSIKYTRELLSYGVAVLFVNDNINTALPDSELRLTIMASMAQDEIRRLSERVKFGMRQSIINGRILGNDLLYGYKKEKSTGNLTIVKEEAEVVRRVFRSYAIDNKSLSRIVKELNSEGIATSQKKKWNTTTISRMISNIKYKGYYCGRKTEIVDYMTKKVKHLPTSEWITYKDKIKIPPIIKEELWELANIRLKSRQKVFDSISKDKTIYKNRYPLSAKIYCANHNEVYHRRKQCKATDDITWLCARYLTKGKKACNSANIRESEIYNILDDIINLLDIKIDNTITILKSLYKKNLKLEKIIDHKKIKEKIIELILDRIVVSKNNDIELKIYINLTNSFIKNLQYKEYEYKRGEGVKGSKEYTVKYKVNTYIGNYL